MPKLAKYRLTWSAKDDDYELRDGSEVLSILAVAWIPWLNEHRSFSFAGRHGRLNLLKERRKAGSSYWYAYQRQGKQIAKRYVGRSDELTVARLEQLAQAFAAKADTTVVPQLEVVANLDSVERTPATEPLLASKLRLPHLHSTLVRRERLLLQLDGGREGKLTLVNAPAGFGKTTLIRQWLEDVVKKDVASTVAWLSLDPGDNDLLRFWRYLITACRAFGSSIGTQSLALLDTSITIQSPLEMITTAFANELDQIRGNSILVLEDFHVITTPLIHEALGFLLARMPSSLHVVLITRTTPPVSLARLRAAGELTEIEAPDLRFSEAETATFLRQAAQWAVLPDEVAQVEARIEGWAAGLRLLTLALQGHQDTESLHLVLANFAAGRRGIDDYFVAEVLNNQPASLQLFLLQTSFLSSLTASLCDSVTACNDSQLLLEALEQANLFLEPLDGLGYWYRYHALFATVMQSEARRRLGEAAVRDLLERAGAWYEAHDMIAESIEAAFTMNTMPRAADLIEVLVGRQFSIEQSPSQRQGPPEFYTLQVWLTRLPHTTVDERPLLSLALATVILFTHIIEMQPISSLIGKEIERLLINSEGGFKVSGQTDRLGQLAALRAFASREQGLLTVAVNWAEIALNLLPPQELTWRSLCIGTLGMGEKNIGHLGSAAVRFVEARTMCETMGNRQGTRAYTIMLGLAYVELNELQQAATRLHQALREAKEISDLADIGYALSGLAEIAYCWNDLDTTWAQASQVVEVTHQYPHEPFYTHAMLILGRVEHARGENAAALMRCAALFAARAVTISPTDKQINAEIAFEQASIALSGGDLAAVQRWRANRPADLERACITLEREQTLLGRLLMAEGEVDAAVRWLEPLLTDADREGRARVALEMRIVLALAYAASSQPLMARHTLVTALASARPANNQRIFIDAGEPLAVLLHVILPTLTDKHLVTFAKILLRALPNTFSIPAEPLSQQERRVLHLLVAGRSNADIAANLFVSINTVKAHVKNIYRKLKVRNRLEAVSAARDLDFLET